MGASRVGEGHYECAHGCLIGGYCPGHDFEVWHREGFYYIPEDGQDYRAGRAFDANFLEALAEVLTDA